MLFQIATNERELSASEFRLGFAHARKLVSRANQECGVNAGLDGSQVLAPRTEHNTPSGAKKLLAYEMDFKKCVKEIFRLNV
jgi:hypothetical protein